MHRHPFFDLWLHDDAELAAFLGSAIVERTTLHEWPLSCVQRLRTADGRRRIYKVQAQPSVEPTFYTRARSPLLVQAQVLEQRDRPAALMLEDMAAVRLADRRHTEEEALRIGYHLLEQIAQIAGDLPAIADIRTEEQWAAYASAAQDDLTALIDAGSFGADHDLVARFARVAESPAVLAAIRSPSGYVHSDLSGDNVLVTDNGYRVIDWQRPLWGPVALDQTTLLKSLGVDPRRYVGSGIIQLRDLLTIVWFAQCARRWYTEGAAGYDAQITELMARAEQASRAQHRAL